MTSVASLGPRMNVGFLFISWRAAEVSYAAFDPVSFSQIQFENAVGCDLIPTI
jgi:hypothetical protein